MCSSARGENHPRSSGGDKELPPILMPSATRSSVTRPRVRSLPLSNHRIKVGVESSWFSLPVVSSKKNDQRVRVAHPRDGAPPDALGRASVGPRVGKRSVAALPRDRPRSCGGLCRQLQSSVVGHRLRRVLHSGGAPTYAAASATRLEPARVALGFLAGPASRCRSIRRVPRCVRGGWQSASAIGASVSRGCS